jgi:hypothetical protein
VGSDRFVLPLPAAATSVTPASWARDRAARIVERVKACCSMSSSVGVPST